jgi:hypothetical protein
VLGYRDARTSVTFYHVKHMQAKSLNNLTELTTRGFTSVACSLAGVPFETGELSVCIAPNVPLHEIHHSEFPVLRSATDRRSSIARVSTTMVNTFRPWLREFVSTGTGSSVPRDRTGGGRKSGRIGVEFQTA